MQRERVQRWALYGSAVWSWLLVGHFVLEVIEHDSRRSMMWLLLCLTIAGALTGAAVIVGSITRLADAAFRLGYQTGRRSGECSARPPALSVVNGGRSEVVRLRADDYGGRC